MMTIPKPKSAKGNGAQMPIPAMAGRYKTKVCQTFVEKGSCPYEARCMFAHGDNDLRTKEMNMTDGLVSEEAIKGFQRKIKVEAAAVAASIVHKAHAAQLPMETQHRQLSATEEQIRIRNELLPPPHIQQQHQQSMTVLHPGQQQLHPPQQGMFAFPPVQQPPLQFQQAPPRSLTPIVVFGSTSAPTTPMSVAQQTPLQPLQQNPSHSHLHRQNQKQKQQQQQQKRPQEAAPGLHRLAPFPSLIPVDDLDTDLDNEPNPGASASGLSGFQTAPLVISNDSLFNSLTVVPAATTRSNSAAPVHIVSVGKDDCRCPRCDGMTPTVVPRARTSAASTPKNISMSTSSRPAADFSNSNSSATTPLASAGSSVTGHAYFPSQRQHYLTSTHGLNGPSRGGGGNGGGNPQCTGSKVQQHRRLSQTTDQAHNPYATPRQCNADCKCCDCVATLV